MWLDRQTTLYSNSKDVIGKPRTIRQVLLTDFARDLSTIIALKKLDPDAPDYKKVKGAMKATLQGWTPAACMQSRAKHNTAITSLTGLMQLDWDREALKDYNIDEVMEAVFSIPYVAFCGQSCSGTGFFALVEIAEPERLEEYAIHLFDVFTEHALPPDTTKGRQPKDLRYCSYDHNMLIRLYPEALKVKYFRKPKEEPKRAQATIYNTTGANTQNRVEAMINQITITGADVTGNYETWLSIGFALAREFGESGRQYFHDVSHNHPAYKFSECERQFTHCLKSNRGGVSINTFFHLCKEANIIANTNLVTNKIAMV